MNTAQTIAKLLLKHEAVRISLTPPFTWTSGIKSPIYCDNRLLISYPAARAAIVEGFKDVIANEKLKFDVIGGTATAAIPWAAFLAAALKKPMVYIRPQPKGHGAGKQVEGCMKKGARVLIVEDLISTGGSSIKSAEACQREYDAEIVGVLSIFNYELSKAAVAFDVAGLPYHSLSNFTTLVHALKLSEKDKKIVLDFANDPDGWADRAGILP